MTSRQPACRRHGRAAWDTCPVVRLVTLTPKDAGEVLTLQRAAYVTEARTHGDLELPPLTQSLDELAGELSDPDVQALGYRTDSGRLVAAVRIHIDRGKGVASVGRLTVAPDLQGRGLWQPPARHSRGGPAGRAHASAAVYRRAQRRQPSPLCPTRLHRAPPRADRRRIRARASRQTPTSQQPVGRQTRPIPSHAVEQRRRPYETSLATRPSHSARATSASSTLGPAAPGPTWPSLGEGGRARRIGRRR